MMRHSASSLIFLFLFGVAHCEPSEMEGDDPEGDISNQGYIIDDDGLKIKILHKPKECDLETKYGDHITWDYYGTLTDGTVFDQGEFWATLGSGQVIEGVDRAMLDMCVGERRHMVLPPDLAYGERGSGDSIPPNSVIEFLVTLKKINRPKNPVVHDDL